MTTKRERVRKAAARLMNALIESLRSPPRRDPATGIETRGTFGKEALARLGVSFPPPKGWRKELLWRAGEIACANRKLDVFDDIEERAQRRAAPASMAAMKEAWKLSVEAIMRSMIENGEQLPAWPIFEQALKTPIAIDTVNEERDAWGDLITADRVIRLEEGTVIARLYNRGHITREQRDAAALYATTYGSAGIDARVTASYGQGTGAGEPSYGMPATVAAAIARDQLRKLRARLGNDTWPLVERVVIVDEPVLQMGYAAYPPWKTPSRRSAIRTGMKLLTHGLDQAFEHFHSGVDRRRRHATAAPVSSAERRAYFARGADAPALEKAMEKIRARNAKRKSRR